MSFSCASLLCRWSCDPFDKLRADSFHHAARLAALPGTSTFFVCGLPHAAIVSRPFMSPNPSPAPIDWSMIASIAAVISALAAVVAALIAIWQARLAARVQVLLQYDAYWTSESLRSARRKAATSLLRKEPSADVDRILDYFETIAGIYVKPHGLFRIRVLPDRWAHHTFYWYAVCYWSKSRDYIESVQSRKSEERAWKDLCSLMPSWIKADGGPPTEKDIDDFLEDEKRA